MPTHRLADGTEVVLGMRVKDYDCKYGVIEDSPRNVQALDNEHQMRTSGGIIPITPDKDSSHTCEAWFTVRCDDGGTSTMDCSRMIAEGGRFDR